MTELSTIALSGHELAVYVKVSLYAMLLDAALAAVGAAFGPFFKRYLPKWYGPLAMLGGAVRALLNSLLAAVRAFVPQTQAAPAAVPASERPTPTVRPPPLNGQDGFARVVALALVALFALGALALAAVPACAPTQRHVAHVAVVGLGSGLAAVSAANQREYTRATNAVIATLADAGGTLVDYDARVAPINAAFTHRSEAIAALDADLYTAAAIVDAGGDGGSYTAAACRAVATLDTHLAVLADGAVLPPLPIPAEITSAVSTLRLLAGRCEVPHVQ